MKDADFPKIEGKELRVFPEDADLPKDAINATADEVFVPMAKVKLPAEAKDFAAWKAGLVKQLREKVLPALPEKVPAAEHVARRTATGREFEPSRGSTVRSGRTLGVGAAARTARPLVVAEPGRGRARRRPRSWRSGTANDARVSASHPRGGGPHRWTRKNPPNTVERSLALLGQTVDSGRVRDVAAVIADRGVRQEADRLRFVGRGPGRDHRRLRRPVRAGVVDEVVILDPPTSHRDGPHFLNVMRVLDIPEALGLLAPDVKLTLIGKNAKDKAFDRPPRSTSSPARRTSSSGSRRPGTSRREPQGGRRRSRPRRGLRRRRFRPTVHSPNAHSPTVAAGAEAALAEAVEHRAGEQRHAPSARPSRPARPWSAASARHRPRPHRQPRSHSPHASGSTIA